MIKRLLILGFVLALPVMSSATTVDLNLTSGGKATLTLGTDVDVDDVITVDLKADGITTSISSPGIDYSASGGTATALITAQGSWQDTAISAGLSSLGTAGSNKISGMYYNVNFGQSVDADATSYSFSITVKGEGTIDITVLSGTSVVAPGAPLPAPYDSITTTSLSIVPEPATIALLGLGGLFLRRRK